MNSTNIESLNWLDELRSGAKGAKDLNGEQKMYLARQLIDNKMSPIEVQNTYHISRNTTKQWVNHVNKGKMILDHGRPPRITKENMIQLVDFVAPKLEKKTNAQFKAKAEELTKKSNKDRGLNVLVKAPSERTLKRYEKENNIENATAEKTTKARHQAVSCV